MPEPLELIVVPHTHWDREWYQTFQQFRARLVRCVDHLLQILDEDPTFTNFMLDGQMVVLEDYLEVQPQEAEHLRRYAQTGRVQVGPWYIQPDEFLVSGEAIVRNLLLGQRLAEPYGGAMAIGYVPDCFGHLAQLPQILRGFGIETATFWRGVGREVQQSEFWWDAPDGSRVRVLYLNGESGYSNARDLPLDGEALLKRVDHIVSRQRPHATANALLLMNGSDHLEPQRGLPAAIAAANIRLGEQGLHLHIGSLPDYARLVQQPQVELHTYSGEWRSPELSHLLPDVLSARMWIKQRNAANEELLTRWADPIAAWAWSLGAPHPTGLLDIAWRFLLKNQPHDSICGCSIDQVHREMVARYDQSEQIAEDVIRESGNFLVQQIDTSALVASGQTNAGGTVPLVVLNPTAGPRDAIVTTQVQLAAPAETLVVADDAGQLVPHTAVAMNGNELFRQAVATKDIDGLLGMVDAGKVLGYHILSVIYDAPQADGHQRVWVTVSDHGEPDPSVMDDALAQVRDLAARAEVHTLDLVISESAWAKLEFAASDLPAFGGRAYLVRARTAGDRPLLSPSADGAGENGWRMENAHLLVEVDSANGELTVTDKATGVVYPHLHRFEDTGDVGDLYNYAPPAQDWAITQASAPPELAWLETSPVRSTLRITQRFALPASCTADRQTRSAETVACLVVSDVTVNVGARRVEVRTTVQNDAQDHRLRVLFPAPLRAAKAVADGTFMVNARPTQHGVAASVWHNWSEMPVNTQPQKRFVSLSDGQRGLAVLNRGLPEYEARPNEDGTTTVALTLLRCVGWLSRDDFSTRRGHAGPMLPTPEGQMQGRWTFEYALVPHAGTWQDNDALVMREADAFANPVRAVPTSAHTGSLPNTFSLVQLAPSMLQLSAIKRAEDGAGIIVRWYNPGDSEVIAELATLVPCAEVSVVSLNERFVQSVTGEPDAPTQRWRVPSPAGRIITLRLVPNRIAH